MAYVRKTRAFEFLTLPFLDILTVVVGGLGAALMVSVPGLFAGKRDAEQLQLVHRELPPVAYGDPYEFLVAVRGGVPPYEWTLGDGDQGRSVCRTSYGNEVSVGLPPGLTLERATGQIKGIVTAGRQTGTSYCIPILVRGRDRVDPQTNAVLVRSPIVSKPYLLSFYGTRDTLDVLGPDSLKAPIGSRIDQKYSVVGTHFDFSVASVSALVGLTVSKMGREIEISGTLPLSFFERIGDAPNLEFTISSADGQKVAKKIPVTIAQPQISFDQLSIRTNYDQPFEAVVGQTYSVHFTAVGGVGASRWSALGGCCLTIDSSTGLASISARDPGRQSTNICVTDVRLDRMGLDTSVCVPFIIDFIHPKIVVNTALTAQFVEEFSDQHVLSYNIQGGSGDAFAAKYLVDGNLLGDVKNISRGDNSVVLTSTSFEIGSA